ncbi:putative late embryogenesis abundant protein-like, partial [Sesbania bispinosa]
MAQVELRDEHGNLVELTDPYGNPVWLTDEHGNPVRLTGVATAATPPSHDLQRSNSSTSSS